MPGYLCIAPHCQVSLLCKEVGVHNPRGHVSLGLSAPLRKPSQKHGDPGKKEALCNSASPLRKEVLDLDQCGIQVRTGSFLKGS